MNSSMKHIFMLLSATALIGGCSSSDDSPSVPTFKATFESATCASVSSQAIVDSGNMGDTSVECGFVTVPANWSEPSGSTIKLAVYKIPSTEATPAPDPVVYLEGGPGGSGVASLKDFATGQSAYLRKRSDVYIIDQRGTGYSKPALVCTEVFKPANGDVNAAHKACYDRFVTDGVNFADYNSKNNARDVNAVREALGIDQWNLYGLSYGTRLALTVMRDVPTGVRSVILDSVFPPEVNGFSESSYANYFAIEQIAANCAADADCKVNVTDIKTLIENGIARLDANPAGDFTAEAYSSLLNNLVANSTAAIAVGTVARGTDAQITELVQLIKSAQGDDDSEDLTAADPTQYPFVTEARGMYYAVVCAEEKPFLTTKAGPDLSVDFTETTQRVVTKASDTSKDIALCDTVYTVPAADAIEAQAVQSNIPTLVLAGTADVATPPGWSKLAAGHLVNSQYAEFPGLTHGLIGNNECLNQITLSFLSDPGTAADQSCITGLPQVDYVTQ